MIYWFSTYVKRAKSGAFEYVGPIDDYIRNLIEDKANTAHDHDDTYYTEGETDALLTGKSDTGHGHPHDHDDTYYTEDEINALLADKADSGHSHSAGIPDLKSFRVWSDSNQAISAATETTITFDQGVTSGGANFNFTTYRHIADEDGLWFYNLRVATQNQPTAGSIGLEIVGGISLGTMPFYAINRATIQTAVPLSQGEEVIATIIADNALTIQGLFLYLEFSGFRIGD